MYFEDITDRLKEKIISLSEGEEIFVVAIDGRCASGKTTLARELSQKLDCNMIHTDDFYLQGFQRNERRYAEPGGNLDRERLIKEVLYPLSKGKKPIYRPFLCQTMDFGDEIRLKDKSIYIIEGSYSCHEELRNFYGMTVFVTTDRETQQERILARNGAEKLSDFLGKWIPLEERYFEAFDVEGKADFVIETSQLNSHLY